jgi:hypothetical protein
MSDNRRPPDRSQSRRLTPSLHRARTGALLYSESYTLSSRRSAPVSFKRYRAVIQIRLGLCTPLSEAMFTAMVEATS